MGGAGESFSWSEDYDEYLNFSIWLHREGRIGDPALKERIQDWRTEGPLQRDHAAGGDRPLWEEYLPVGQAWRRGQIARHLDLMRARRSGDRAVHYRAMSAI